MKSFLLFVLFRGILLLIVPEGIEIVFNLYNNDFLKLLIVPEGIEIIMLRKQKHKTYAFNRTRRNWNFVYSGRRKKGWKLLIVPEGIEISSYSTDCKRLPSFNRTRRNWNTFTPLYLQAIKPFNRTRRNWNDVLLWLRGLSFRLLIVPEGIEIRIASMRL